jgi:hypothetical protein
MMVYQGRNTSHIKIFCFLTKLFIWQSFDVIMYIIIIIIIIIIISPLNS